MKTNRLLAMAALAAMMLGAAATIADADGTEPIRFANYSVDGQTVLKNNPEGAPIGSIWSGRYASGPWTWLDETAPATPFWHANVTAVSDGFFTGPPSLDENMVLLMPYAATYTISAHEGTNTGPVIGTMVFDMATPGNVVDYDASNAIVDEETGMIMIRFGHPVPGGEPFAILTLTAETGVFAEDGIDLVGEQQMFSSGCVQLPLIDGMALQDNIFATFPIGGIGETVWVGHYVPEPATLLLLAGGGALALLRRRRRGTC